MESQHEPGPGPHRGKMYSRLRRLDVHLRAMVMTTMLLLAVGAGIGIDRYLVENTPAGAQSSGKLTDVTEFSILDDTYETIRANYA